MSRNRQAGNIELHIEELVLHGFPRSQQHRIGEAIRQELLRQFSEGGIPDVLTRQDNISRLNAGSIQVEQGGKPERIGMQVAQAVYSSVGGDQLLNNGTPGLNSGQTRSMHK